ncbi:MAG: phospholipid carrier-dependent glycosyltransferase, partial [Thermomicrobiales bacterium]
ETIFGLTESLVERGSIVVPTCAGCTIIHSEPAPGGRNYSRYGPLQSFVAVPFYVAGRAVAGENDAARWFLTRFAVDMMNPLVTAVTAALLYLLARWLGYRHGAALAAALAYGLGTQAWPHSKTFFSEPLTTFLLLGAVCCWWRLAVAAGARRAAWWAAGIGVCCGLAIATKYGAGIAVPVLALAAAVALWGHWRAGRLALRGVALAGLAGVVGLAVPVGLVGLYNWVRFASLFATGYGGGEVGAIQGGGFWNGLGGLLISPGKSVFLFSPLVLLALAAWPAFARRQRGFALVAGCLILTHLLFYARVPYWHGDVAWGPRYLDFVMPLLVLPLAGGYEWLARQRDAARRVALAATVVVCLLALVVQALALTVNFDVGFNAAGRGSRYWNWRNSPPLLHARILGERLGEWRDARFPQDDGIIPGTGFALLNEDDPPWPRFLPREAALHVHAAGDGPVHGALVYEDARAQRDPPQQLAILVNGQPAAGRAEMPGAAPATYRIDFTIRPAGGSGHDFTVTIRNDAYAALGPNRLVSFAATAGDQALSVQRRPLLLPFPQDSAGRWSWSLAARNQHLADFWQWYVAILHLPPGLTRLLLIGLDGLAGLVLLGAAVSLARYRDLPAR